MKKLWLFSIVILAAGCAGSPEKKEAITPLALEVKAPVNSKINDVQAIAESAVKPGKCPQLNERWKNEHKWKDAVDACTACMKARDLTKVEEIAEELSRRELSNPWGPYFMAMVARQQDHLERAMWMVELASKRSPNSGLIYYLRGQILWDQKSYDPAILAFEKAVEYDNSITAAHMVLGQVYFRDQDFRNAVTHFDVVLKSESKNRIALQGYAQSQWELKNAEESFRAFDKLSDLEPNDGSYLSQMADIQENMLHHPEEALNIYQRLSRRMKSGDINKNGDDQVDMKIKKLEAQLNKTRAVANVNDTTKAKAQKDK